MGYSISAVKPKLEGIVFIRTMLEMGKVYLQTSIGFIFMINSLFVLNRRFFAYYLKYYLKPK